MLLSFGIVVWNEHVWLLAGAATFSFLSLLTTNFKVGVNLPNFITASRFVIIILAAIMVSSLNLYQFFGLMLLAVLLDVFDGYIARRLKKSTELGFYFDLEVDAFYVLVMSLYFFQFRDVPWWMLVPGIMRYLFIVVTLIFPKNTFNESKKPYASFIAGLYFVILLVSIVIPIEWATPLLGIGGFGIIISFSISFIEYFRWK